MLKMKSACEHCGVPTKAQETAYICSFECTYCEACSTAFKAVCPNCSGELLRRPKRLKKPLDVAKSQLKAKLFNR